MILYDNPIPVTASRLRRARIPEKFWSWKPSLAMDSQAQEQIKALYLSMPSWLETGTAICFMGPMAAQKTACACFLLRRAIEFSARCICIHACELTFRRYDTYQDQAVSLEDQALRSDLLLLDDLAESDSARKKYFRYLDWLLYEREAHCRPTIVTTREPLSRLGRLGITRAYNIFRYRVHLGGEK